MRTWAARLKRQKKSIGGSFVDASATCARPAVADLVLRPCSRSDARKAVADWHSHHEPHVGELFAVKALVDGAIVAVAVVGRPVSPVLDQAGAWEVTRLAVGPDAPHCTASKLLGCVWRIARAYDVRRMASYTRVDEDGTCYRAAGWVAVELVEGRPHTTGNRAARWLPGMYEPSTEIVDRVRWEIGPDAAPSRVARVAGAWTRAA